MARRKLTREGRGRGDQPKVEEALDDEEELFGPVRVEPVHWARPVNGSLAYFLRCSGAVVSGADIGRGGIFVVATSGRRYAVDLDLVDCEACLGRK